MKIFVISITSSVMQSNGTARKTCRPLVLLFFAYDSKNNIQAAGLTYDTNGRLILANGKTISYDQMGNPTTYKGQTFTWEQGRKLVSGTMNNTNSIAIILSMIAFSP